MNSEVHRSDFEQSEFLSEYLVPVGGVPSTHIVTAAAVRTQNASVNARDVADGRPNTYEHNS